MTVSVLILTLNEEVNIGACLESVSWCEDVVVLDSGSTDSTVSIAQRYGARIVQREFDNYANQRNHGLKEIKYKNAWVLMLDADERVTVGLRTEIMEFAAAPVTDVTLVFMRRRDHLFGRWIKHSSGYPTWFGRLARIGSVWVERPINEVFCTSGQSKKLSSHLDHYPFNKGFSQWVLKHDRYSTMEAELLLQRLRQPLPLRDVWTLDPVRRRAAIKAVAYRLPGRPVLMFIGLYVLKGGVLEGRAGLTFSLLRTWYEFMIDCKYRELMRRNRGMPV